LPATTKLRNLSSAEVEGKYKTILGFLHENFRLERVYEA